MQMYMCSNAQEDIKKAFSDESLSQEEKKECLKRAYCHALTGDNKGKMRCRMILHYISDKICCLTLRKRVKRIYCMKCWDYIRETLVTREEEYNSNHARTEHVMKKKDLAFLLSSGILYIYCNSSPSPRR